MWSVWCVAICLLQLGDSNAEITQQPSLVLQEGRDARFSCHQTDKHERMYWYRQNAVQGLEFLYYFFNTEEQQRGNVLERFTAKQPEKYQLSLNISRVKREDSAVYLCASSKSQHCRITATSYKNLLRASHNVRLRKQSLSEK